MTNERLTRRAVLAGAAAAGASTVLAADPKPEGRPVRPTDLFGYCLNTSTVRLPGGQWGKSRPVVELVEIAAKAGYQAIEPWVSELDEYVKGGGSLKDLRKRISDAGLAVPDAIGFPEWLVADPARRKKGLDEAKRNMEMVREIGGGHIAAPPVGATGGTSRRDDPKFTQPVVNLTEAADRYRALLDLGKSMGVTPIAEVWGFSKTLSRLGETMLVAMECGAEGGSVLPDVYHLYKGGSEFTGLKLLGPHSIGIFHVNDYPKIDRAKITDQDRVYPGDGVAPLADALKTLREVGYRGYLSLELFNHEYWKQDPHQVAKTGLEKTKAVVKAAG